MNIKVLVDLKPALDGYAGIPQETRLLFANLSKVKTLQIQGLIQHGSKKIKPGLKISGVSLSSAKKVNKLGKVVISIAPSQKQTYANKLLDIMNFHLVKIQTLLGKSISRSVFETEHFQDFIWRSFFSKSLDSSYKKNITSLKYYLIQPSRQTLHQVGLENRYLGFSPIYAKINTKGAQFFLAQTPFPGRVSQETILLIRYHDAVPLLMPDTISENKMHQASHFYALQDNVQSGAWFICISESSRQDLIKLFPEVEGRTRVIHNIVSDEFFESDINPQQVLKIISNRIGNLENKKNKKMEIKKIPFNIENINFDINKEFEFLLTVSTIEPRKNYFLLLEVFEQLKATTHPNLKIIIVGSLGWEYTSILQAFIPLAMRGDLFYLSDVPIYELRVLYQCASATICPSLGEGFGYPGVEAMRCGGIVIASDIPVHREIYDNASVYFDPYNVKDAASIIAKTLNPSLEGEALRSILRTNAKQVSARYLKENVLLQWRNFFENFPNSIKILEKTV